MFAGPIRNFLINFISFNETKICFFFALQFFFSISKHITWHCMCLISKSANDSASSVTEAYRISKVNSITIKLVVVYIICFVFSFNGFVFRSTHLTLFDLMTENKTKTFLIKWKKKFHGKKFAEIFILVIFFK